MAPDADIDQLLRRFASGRYRPATFLERGVTLPLTTPSLLGARIRPAERKGAELVLPNPSGAEGAYILPWTSLTDVCAPTLHDRALWEKVCALPVLSPSSVRDAARQVAAEGFAGRSAQRAAGQTDAARQQAQILAEYQMLLSLLRQEERPGLHAIAPERDQPANVQRRVRAVLRERADQLSPAAALQAMEQAAAAFAPIGVGAALEAAPLRQLAASLRLLVSAIATWAGDRPPEARGCADLVTGAIELTLRCVRRALAEARALQDDIWHLLRRWEAESDQVRAITARPDWLLDGWDVIRAIWWTGADGSDEGALAALSEMATLIPVIPAEARDWLGFDVEGDMERHRTGLRKWRRTVLARQDWTTGRIDSPAERLESMRALCA